MATAADELALRRLDDATRDARRLQLETLREILAENAGAACLRRYIPSDDGGHHLLLSTDLAAAADEFRRLVPVTSYDDYYESIRRVADGDAAPDVLSPRPLLCFFLSSGTSSLRPKLIPYLDSPGARAASAAVMQANSALVRRLFPPRPAVSKALWFLYAGEVRKTKGGYEAMAATAWGIRGASPVISACVSPAEVILGADHHQQMYCHLLCGLRRWDAVDCIRAPYAAALARALRLLQSKWRLLCDDLESGTVSADIVTDAAMRRAVQDDVLAGPCPELADRVRRICERDDWRGVVRHLWPEARYISCVTTGTMAQYFPAIKHFAGEALPVLGTDYLASECAIGINLERTSPPEETTYVLLPTAAYFEFIPSDMDAAGRRGAAAEPVDIAGVEAGKTYEVVATTFRGLYRYRLGDVVKVAGFHNSSPRLQFVTRAPPPPQEHGEVLTERDVMAAMDTFQLMLKDGVEESLPAGGGEVVEFAAFIIDGDGGGRRRRATIAVEVSKGSRLLDHESSGDDSVAFLRRCITPLEGCLGGAYRLSRATGDVAPLEVAVVRPGTFDRLTEAAIRGGAPANQYKPPKIVRHRQLVHVLQSSVVCSCSSPAAPAHGARSEGEILWLKEMGDESSSGALPLPLPLPLLVHDLGTRSDDSQTQFSICNQALSSDLNLPTAKHDFLLSGNPISSSSDCAVLVLDLDNPEMQVCKIGGSEWDSFRYELSMLGKNNKTLEVRMAKLRASLLLPASGCKVDEIGDRVFLLGGDFIGASNFGASCSASDHGLSGNCIYFVNNIAAEENFLNVIDLEKGTECSGLSDTAAATTLLAINHP
uniref:Uncharacterized protein n=1 Tax=Oryza punctata TaxID=4537 RepID=A0A0E0KYD2_ORYPU